MKKKFFATELSTFKRHVDRDIQYTYIFIYYVIKINYNEKKTSTCFSRMNRKLRIYIIIYLN